VISTATARASRLPWPSAVRLLGWLSRVLLISGAIVTCAVSIHAHVVEAPEAITQEVNQCLRLVNVAASRRIATPVSTRPRLAYHTRTT